MGNDGYKRQLAVSSGTAAQLGGCYCKSLNPVGRMRLSFNLIQKRSRIKTEMASEYPGSEIEYTAGK